jgi:hypothetical protein
MSYLSRNPEAEQLHQDGLQAALHGKFGEAQEHFGSATQIVSELPETLDNVVQAACITRDTGFTYIHAAIKNDYPLTLLEEGKQALTRSAEMTAPMVSGLKMLPIEKAQPHNTPKQARRELMSEHGTTLSLLGRTALVKIVIKDRDFHDGSIMPEQQYYGLAHDILRIGNNGYHRVSNDMVGARQEYLNGRQLHAAKWLQRALFDLGWTAVQDRHNLPAASRTFMNRLAHLRSPSVARKSIITQP